MAKDAAVEVLFEAVNAALAALPPLGSRTHSQPAALPILHVVGVPRSGNTVLHQLVCRHLPVAWVDNVIARFWRRPSVGVAVSRTLGLQRDRARLRLESLHGTTAGAGAPHEFGYFWRHWLRLDDHPTHHLDAAALARVDRAGLKSALEQELLRGLGTPLALRNPICGFHAAFLTEVHPATLFLRIRRSPHETARSILRCRHERFGRYDAWWSLKPSTWPFGAASPAEEVARQVHDCTRELDAALADPTVRAVTLDYQALAADPRGALESIRKALAGLGADLAVQGQVPARLEAPRSGRLPPELEDSLDRALAALGAEELG